MRLKATLAILALFATTASAGGIYWATSGEKYVISQRDASQADISLAMNCLQGGEPRECMEKLGDVAVESGNVKVYIDQMRQVTQKDPTLLSACHQMLHDFGENLTYRAGSEAVFAMSYTDCTFAFFHGAIWAITKDLSFEELRADISTICQPFFEKAGYQNDASRECVHGIGHLLWEKAPKNDLATAMEACGNAGDPNIIEPCVIGANMEMEVAVTGGSRWVRSGWDMEMFAKVLGSTEPEAALERYRQICAAASQEGMRTGCLTGWMLMAFTLYERDVAKVFSVCDTMPEGNEQSQCRSYTGAVVIENSVTAQRRGWDPVLMAQMCESYPSTAEPCATMVMSQIYRISQSLGEEFCSSLTPATQKVSCEAGRARARDYNAGLAQGVGA